MMIADRRCCNKMTLVSLIAVSLVIEKATIQAILNQIKYGISHDRGCQYYSSTWKTLFFLIRFFGHYTGNHLLPKLNIFAEGKYGKNLSHQHQAVFKI